VDEGGNRDSAKIAIGTLGLPPDKNPFPPNLRQRAVKISVNIDQISLGRPALDRERLLRNARDLAEGLKPAGGKIEAIRLSQNPDGSFTVSGDGNHRIAALKLMGYRGEIPVEVQLQKKARKSATPKSTTAPTLPAAPSPPILTGPAPAGKPVRDGLKLPTSGDLRQISERALTAIEKVHGDGNLPQIPVEIETRGDRLGGYHYNPIGPRAVKITVKTGSRAEIDLAHEIGHFLDQQGAGKGINHASPYDAAFTEFRGAVLSSRAVKELRQFAGDSTYSFDHRYLNYLLEPIELWARAYAQYIAIRSGDATLLGQLNYLRQQRGPVYYPAQWSDDDFEDIARAMDRLMIKLGWRK
jgi:hypothetical protein